MTQDEESSSPNNSTGTVFAWVGAILINASFVALIAWGTYTNWPVGFVFAGIYTAVLLVASFVLRRRNGGSNNILTSLLFFLSVVAIAVAGSYLPLNLIECVQNGGSGGIIPPFPEDGSSWVTDTSNLSASVQNWWAYDHHNGPSRYQSNTFIYLPDNDITLFRGSGGGSYNNNQTLQKEIGENLWIVSSGSAPVNVPDIIYPKDFVLVEEEDNDSTTAACFVNNFESVLCTANGEDIETILFNEDIQNPRDLFYSDGLIWFRADPPRYAQVYAELLYSVNPSDGNNVVLYSRQRQRLLQEERQPEDNVDGANDEDDDGDSSCNENQTRRLLFGSLLVASALPSVALAFLLSFRYKVPSMPFGGYLSLSWAVICLVFVIDPGFDDLLDFFRWWFVFTAGPWLIILTLAHLTSRMTQEGLTWGLNFAGLMYIVGMFMLTKVFDGGDVFWRWAVLTIAGIIPLIVLSIVTGRILLMVLASVGLLIDVWRLTDYVTEVVGLGDNAPVQFIVLGLSGLALGFFGYILSKYQSVLQAAVTEWSETNLGRWRLRQEEQDEEYDEGDDTVVAKSIEEHIEVSVE